MVALICAMAMPAVADELGEVSERLVNPEGLEYRLMTLGADQIVSQSCCKTCRKGKACGDSCISRNKTCRAGRGCACDG